MNTEEIQQKILTDDDFVLTEVEKIRYLYRLKHEIRYAQKRDEVIHTESVAEHIYGMHVVATYFLPLEDTEKKLNRDRLFEMISWHDMDEIETGDIISIIKTQSDRDTGRAAIPKVLSNLPGHIEKHVAGLINEYEEQSTPEARFVKAIDKVEPSFEVFNKNYKAIMQSNGETFEMHINVKQPYVKEFAYINRFAQVIADKLKSQDFFVK